MSSPHRQLPPLVLDAISVQQGNHSLLQGISARMHLTDGWGITGASGSGKTLLGLVLARRVFARGRIIYPEAGFRVALLDQQHHFTNRSNTGDLYYQQRFQSADAEDSPTAAEWLQRMDLAKEEPAASPWIRRLQLESLLNRPLIQLSNGEHKRLQLAAVLRHPPHLLILDSPDAGLDPSGRKALETAVTAIRNEGIAVLWMGSENHMPDFITRLLVLEQGRLVYAGPRNGFSGIPNHRPRLAQVTFEKKPAIPDFAYAVRMRRVSVRYGSQAILQDINWTVQRGECWRIAGRNGAGKSTLLSLVTADNPQAYANEIWLFDKRRGRGESIWDIKRRIGFLGPELHLHFDRSCSLRQCIGSGFFDSIGLFRKLSEQQEEAVAFWLHQLGLQPQQNLPLGSLSTGRQRLVLLARAMVKQPDLLVLDEPAQGLDEPQTRDLLLLVDHYCRQTGSTLLYVTHYDMELPECINRQLLLENGKQVN